MSDDDRAVIDPNESDIELDELHQGEMDRDMLEAYFRDLQAAHIIEVLLKGAAGAYAGQQRFTLEQGRDAFLAGNARGLQIRYVWEEREWWDTLIATRDGARVVRVDKSMPIT